MADVPPVTSGRRRVTLHDVAREAGVSYATASRALNGSDRTVRAGNVDRVKAAAAKLGYTPDISAQAIARGSTQTAAMVVSDVDDPYFSTIAAGAGEAAEAAGLVLTMAVADRSPELELQIVRTLRGQRPRAIVITGSRITGAKTRTALIEELTAYRTAGGRIVLISQDDLPFDTLATDNRGGARRLALALVQLGYRTFAVLHAPEAIRTSAERRAGFAAGLREAGVKIAKRHEIEVPFTREGGVEGVQRLLKKGLAGIEAVFAVNDMMAIGAMTALRDAGLTPGHDIAVAGFDDVESTLDVTPALTTVRIPLRKVGQMALQIALSGKNHGTVPVETEVILRESTPARPA